MKERLGLLTRRQLISNQLFYALGHIKMRRLAVELRERTAKAAQQHYRKTKGLISHLSCSSPIFIFIWVVM